MLPSLSHLFAGLLNIAVKLHPEADTTALHGHSFAIAIDELPQDIAIRVQDGKIVAVAEAEVADVDVIVSGNLKAVLKMLQDEEAGLDNDALYISGKISTLKRFQHFINGLGIHWQAFFAQFMDDNKAAKLTQAIEQSLHVAKGGIEQLGQGIKQYVIDDKQWLVSQAELDEFSRAITMFYQRLDRLNKRLAQLT